MFLQRQLTVTGLVAALGVGCASPTAPLNVDATVRLTHSVETSCWTLVTTAGKVYEPVDLPAAFRVEGLAVHVGLSDAPGWATICYAGPLVHVDDIQTR
jgi:hypothetical protein